jgi:hypothetical protein
VDIFLWRGFLFRLILQNQVILLKIGPLSYDMVNETICNLPYTYIISILNFARHPEPENEIHALYYTRKGLRLDAGILILAILRA